MALTWKVIAVTPDQAEEGCGTWEPFGVGHDADGEEVVLCKGFVDDELDKDPKDTKASEVTGGLGKSW